MELELAYNILDILGTMQDAVRQMQVEYSMGNMQQFKMLSTDLQDGLIVVQEIAGQNFPPKSQNRLADACTCALESLKDIKQLILLKPEKVDWKLKYELSAIIETMTLQFYYWGIVDEHPEERRGFLDYIADTDTFRVLKKPEEEREYDCDLVILVIGYNKLDYTMRCVQSVLDNLPQGISFQLVLYNHGSNDGTKAYFESIEEARVINVAINNAVPGVLYRVESGGRYFLCVSNDVVVGENAIDNLFRCAVKHPEYGYIVPSTSAVSNFQTIPGYYENREGFLEFTRRNNVYDERRHEQRVRLVNPLHVMPASVMLRMELDLYEDKTCQGSHLAFPDDKTSAWIRRHGYKCILAKDAYCHHEGSVTINSQVAEESRQRMYLKGREAFIAYYGIDPWGVGACYDHVLFSSWEPEPVDGACILGINCGIGSNSLKVKELMREQGAEDVCLVNCVQDGRYLEDLRGVSDEAYVFDCLFDIILMTKRKWYDCIVVEEAVTGCCQESIEQELLNAGIRFGQIAYKVGEEWRIRVHAR